MEDLRSEGTGTPTMMDLPVRPSSETSAFSGLFSLSLMPVWSLAPSLTSPWMAALILSVKDMFESVDV